MIPFSVLHGGLDPEIQFSTAIDLRDFIRVGFAPMIQMLVILLFWQAVLSCISACIYDGEDRSREFQYIHGHCHFLCAKGGKSLPQDG